MNPPLNDRTAKIMLGHVHRIGMSLTSFESELQGSPALTKHMEFTMRNMRVTLQQAQQEIIDLRDGKS